MSKAAYPVEVIRHSTAHLLAAAVTELWPKTALGVGPVIENGFFYDFGLPAAITESDLAKIEARMRELVKRGAAFKREEMPIDEAIIFFEKLGQPYKVELLRDLKFKGTTAVKSAETQDVDPARPTTVSVYRNGDFVDLCRGPHVAATSDLGAFKLAKVAGAYWRGNEKNPMLTRVYGYAFQTDPELKNFLALLTEAEKRDHKKLGRELGLFLLLPEVGGGLPLWTPKGTVIRETMTQFLRGEQLKRGYLPVTTPHIGKLDLYKTSGHFEHYRESMYAPIRVEDEEYILKPMNCPHHIQIYRSEPRSYRDLPLRYAEFGTVYRYEKSGELSGLARVRGFTVDDAHIITRTEEIKNEFLEVIDLILFVWKKFGFTDFRARFGTRDPKSAKYVGDDKMWARAEQDIEAALKEKKMAYTRAPGEAAFYGPKLDFLVKDALGREWQLGTAQVDYNLPARFDLEYVGQDGKKHRPVIIHRAPFGSLERFIGILIEHYAGAFPVWLAPVQVAVIPVGSRHVKSAERLAAFLKEADLRVACDGAQETVGYKIRKAERDRVPYMLVVGDKEAKGLASRKKMPATRLAVRLRGQKTVKNMTVKRFAARVQAEMEKNK